MPPGLPGTGARASGTESAPDSGARIARQTAPTSGLLTSRGDIHLDGAVGRHPSRWTPFVDHIAVDDLHCETIMRIARAALCVDGDAPASIEGRRRDRTLFRPRVEGAPRPLRFGS